MLKRPFYLSLFTLALGQFSKISENIYLFDLVVTLFGLYGVYHFNRSYLLPKPLYFLYLFCFSGLISLFISIYKYNVLDVTQAIFYLIRLCAYLVSANTLYNMLKFGLITLREIKLAILFSGVFLIIAGLIQLVILPDFTTLDPSLGWDPHKNRMASTFFDPNFLGAYLVVCLALVVSEFKLTTRHFALLSLFLLAIILTFSRSAWLMLAVVVFVYGIYKSKVFLMAALVVVLLAYFAVPRIQTRLSGVTDSADSAAFRLISWKNTTIIIKDNWLLGVGYNAFKPTQKLYGFLDAETEVAHSASGSDSSLLLILATAGIIGFAVFASSIMLILKDAFAHNNFLIISILGGLFLESFFINSLFYPQILFVTLAIIFSFQEFKCFSFRK